MFFCIKSFTLILFAKIIHANPRNEFVSYFSDDGSNATVVSSETILVTFSSGRSLDNAELINRSLLEVPSTNSSLRTSLVCFPEEDEGYQQTYTLSHIVCRRMGFMTFVSIEAKQAPSAWTKVKPKNIACSKEQRSGYQCEATGSSYEMCPTVTEVICGACNGTIKGFKGSILSPGFPHSSPEDVTCEWNIIVPEHHGILLFFDNFDAMNTTHAKLPCGLHRPYILIMYGIQSKVTVHRYCQLDQLKNLSIPFHSVKLIVFTGLNAYPNRSASESELGIAIRFEATIPPDEVSGSPVKIVSFVLMGVVFIFCIIICHYIQKHKMCDYIVKDVRSSNHYLLQPMQLATDVHPLSMKPENENGKLIKSYKNVCVDAEKGNRFQNTKTTFEPRKEIYRCSSMFETSTKFSPNLVPVEEDCFEPDRHTRLHLLHSYHGEEDPNRLSVSSTLQYNYPCLQSSRHDTQESCFEE